MSDEQRLSEEVLARLTKHVTALDARLRAPALLALATRLVALTDGQVTSDWSLVQALVAAASEAMNHVEELTRQARELTERYEAAGSDAARAAIVREQLSGSEPDRAHLVRDLRAMRRHLDLDVLLERSSEHVSVEIDRVELAYRAAAGILQKTSESSARGSDPEPALRQAYEHVKGTSIEIVAVEALHFMRAVLARHPSVERLPLLGAERFRTLGRFGGDARRGAWVQVAALELCVTAEPARTSGSWPDACAITPVETA